MSALLSQNLREAHPEINLKNEMMDLLHATLKYAKFKERIPIVQESIV